jgi:predicted Rossmann fold nucleotide-binding protein DprA/Smf involved in DNA uptake
MHARRIENHSLERLRPFPISPADPGFPRNLRRFPATYAHTLINAMGCLSLLARPTLALFCSVKCTGTLILETFEFARRLGPSGPVVISGFHSPMERQCLEVLLLRKVPVVICPARGLGRFRVRSEWNRAAAEGNVLVASPFDPRQRRATTELSLQRNRFVAALADQILVPYAAPGGKMEGFVREIAAWGKPIVTFRCEDNRLLSELGAREISEDEGVS